MIGITVSADQLRAAPPAVRQWIESEVAAALAVQLVATPPDQNNGLAACSAEEVRAIFSLIQNVVPAVSVFLELGHQGVSVAGGALEAYRLPDLMGHARLGSADQLMTLLGMINGALHRVRGTTDVSLYGLDGRGHCFIATQTRQNINDLWKRLVDDSHDTAENPEASSNDGAHVQPPMTQVPGDNQAGL